MCPHSQMNGFPQRKKLLPELLKDKVPEEPWGHEGSCDGVVSWGTSEVGSGHPNSAAFSQVHQRLGRKAASLRVCCRKGVRVCSRSLSSSHTCWCRRCHQVCSTVREVSYPHFTDEGPRVHWALRGLPLSPVSPPPPPTAPALLPPGLCGCPVARILTAPLPSSGPGSAVTSSVRPASCSTAHPTPFHLPSDTDL